MTTLLKKLLLIIFSIDILTKYNFAILLKVMRTNVALNYDRSGLLDKYD